MRNSSPSNFRTDVNTTVLAGMFRPIEKVSVENKACVRQPRNNDAMIKDHTKENPHHRSNNNNNNNKPTQSTKNNAGKISRIQTRFPHDQASYTLSKLSWNKISTTSFKIGKRPLW
jgi:hypothetical protein